MPNQRRFSTALRVAALAAITALPAFAANAADGDNEQSFAQSQALYGRARPAYAPHTTDYAQLPAVAPQSTNGRMVVSHNQWAAASEHDSDAAYTTPPLPGSRETPDEDGPTSVKGD